MQEIRDVEENHGGAEEPLMTISLAATLIDISGSDLPAIDRIGEEYHYALPRSQELLYGMSVIVGMHTSGFPYLLLTRSICEERHDVSGCKYIST